MLKKGLFRKPRIELETYDKFAKTAQPTIPEEMCITCPSCKSTLFVSDLSENYNICEKCGHHFRINARQRISLIFDEDTFTELYGDMRSKNIIDFPNYDKKLKSAALESAEKEAVVCGFGKVGGFTAASFIMEPYFMMGSMGTVVG